jgi:hypothetical protein
VQEIVSAADQASKLIESLPACSSLTKDRKLLLLEATARKIRLGLSLEEALKGVEPMAEYVPVEVESLIFPAQTDSNTMLGLLFALVLSI